MDNNLWYVVQTQINAEQKAKINLERQGYTCFLPQYKKLISHARKKQIVLRALFPRYLFVSFNTQTHRWRSIQSTLGVSSLIMDGEQPSFLPNGIIENLMNRQDETGCIEISARTTYKIGEKIRITSGAFEETLGLVEGFSDKDRVNILINMLGRKTKVTVKIEQLKKEE